MKKIAIAAIAAAALNTTVSAENCASNFSGFYAGLQAGMNMTVGTVKINDYSACPGTHQGMSNFKNKSGSNAFVGGLFAGYGMGIGSCAYVGGEVYGNFSDINNKVFDTSENMIEYQTFKITAKNNMNLGAKIRLGYTISPQAMIFLGLGLEYARWQLRCKNISLEQERVETTVKKNKNVVSFAPSVGMEMLMTKNIFVRGEYTYVVGTSQKLEPKQQLTLVGRSIINTSAVKVNTDQHRFVLGLGYKF